MAANTVTLAKDVLGAGGDGVDDYLVWAAGLYNLVEAAGNAGVVLGTGNRVLGSGAMATGNQCVASGSAARAHGESCTASRSTAVAEGMGSEAVGSGSRALGLYPKARLAGQTAAAQGRFATAGDAQEAVYRMAIATSNATPAELRIAGTGRLLVDAGRTMSCLVNVVARSSTGESASFLRRVVVKNVAGVVSLVGSVETVGSDQKDAGAAAWVVAITADDANDALAVAVTGAAGVAIRWHAVVQGSEVVY